jgi:hypothetical protein
MEPAPPPKENAWVRRSQQSQSATTDDPAVSTSVDSYTDMHSLRFDPLK